MTLFELIKRVQAIVRDDSYDFSPLPPVNDNMEVPEEFRDILIATTAAKYLESNQ